MATTRDNTSQFKLESAVGTPIQGWISRYVEDSPQRQNNYGQPQRKTSRRDGLHLHPDPANKLPWYNCAWEHHKPFEARCITLKVKEYNGPKKNKQLNPEDWYHLDYIGWRGFMSHESYFDTHSHKFIRNVRYVEEAYKHHANLYQRDCFSHGT